MSIERGRAATSIRRAIEHLADPRHPTSASNGVGGYSMPFAIGGIQDVHGDLDMKPLISQGYWTEDDGWSLQWMRLISQGYLTE